MPLDWSKTYRAWIYNPNSELRLTSSLNFQLNFRQGQETQLFYTLLININIKNHFQTHVSCTAFTINHSSKHQQENLVWHYAWACCNQIWAPTIARTLRIWTLFSLFQVPFTKCKLSCSHAQHILDGKIITSQCFLTSEQFVPFFIYFSFVHKRCNMIEKTILSVLNKIFPFLHS